ncbi:MAG TPA: AAA family ATPase [Methanosarcinales archaeon]|nr:AAA family ATPase [Methanosarcinales archaeon]
MKQEIWIEKYRPKKLSLVVGQDEIIKYLENYVKSKNLPHLLFSGPPGVGKTASAVSLARELFGDTWRSNFTELNASDERGIDVVRDKIKNFARTSTLGGAEFKIIFLDEADALCLHPDTEVIVGFKSNKKVMKIKDVPQDKYIHIPSLNIETKEIENDKGISIDSGNADFYKITLEDGREIIASTDHPFFMLDEEENINEIKLRDLKEGDEIVDFQDDLGI